jgi:hypothetical protein
LALSSENIKIMKKYLIILILFVTKSFAQTPDEIFNKYFEATGGKDLWDGIKTYNIKQTFRANATTDYDMEVAADAEKQQISKVKTILKRDFIYTTKGSEGFLKIPMGPRDKATKFDVKDLSEKEKTAMQNELSEFLVPFLNHEKRGCKVTANGLEKDGEKNLNKVTIACKSANYELWFDAESGLIDKEKVTIDKEIFSIDIQKYAKSAYGISYPSEAIQVSSIDKKNTKVTTSITFNSELEAALFVR